MISVWYLCIYRLYLGNFPKKAKLQKLLQKWTDHSERGRPVRPHHLAPPFSLCLPEFAAAHCSCWLH